uniref:Uncharacterized protein n=1 Tax=Lactuca sativa TaxID=4236 RepID=A0A9R1UFG0_LACSA|nr:hypothetical protein LSAT_V11C900477200 [Lactuca sativa]
MDPSPRRSKYVFEKNPLFSSSSSSSSDDNLFLTTFFLAAKAIVKSTKVLLGDTTSSSSSRNELLEDTASSSCNSLLQDTATSKRKAVIIIASLIALAELKMDVATSTMETDAPEKNLNKWDFTCDVEVDCKSEENAYIIYSTLNVDKELQPDKVRRLMSVSNGKLSVRFEAVEARFLRASFSAFMDALTLATKTIEQFGKDMEL